MASIKINNIENQRVLTGNYEQMKVDFSILDDNGESLTSRSLGLSKDLTVDQVKEECMKVAEAHMDDLRAKGVWEERQKENENLNRAEEELAGGEFQLKGQESVGGNIKG